MFFLDKLILFAERFGLDILFSVLKVIHLKPLYYSLSEEAFTYVADVCEEFDLIADANEIHLPYVAYVYGKSKTHFIRIIGNLWALEVAFKVLTLIDPIPTVKNEFIEIVTTKFAEINDSNVITIDIVKSAVMVINYFINHKMIMSGMKKDASNSKLFTFINKAAAAKSAKFELSSKKTNFTLELLILTTPGEIVFLTPLSKSGKAKEDTFEAASKNLASKGFGEFGKFRPNPTINRTAHGFKKSPVPEADSEAEIVFINDLFDFGCNFSDYKATLSQPNIKTPSSMSAGARTSKSLLNDEISTPTQKSSNLMKKNTSQKRMVKETTLEDISNLQKQYRAESSSDEEVGGEN